jgi:hypothetical protein
MHLVEGDSGSTLQVTCRDQYGELIDLTLVSPTLRFKIGEGTAAERAMTKVDAPNGVCKITFQGDDLTPGEMRYEVVLTEGSAILTSSRGHIAVRAKIA